MEHSKVDGPLKSLTSLGMVELKIIEHKSLGILPDGESVLKDGSPEVRVFHAIPVEGGISRKDLDVSKPHLKKKERKRKKRKKRRENKKKQHYK